MSLNSNFSSSLNIKLLIRVIKFYIKQTSTVNDEFVDDDQQ